MRTKYEPLVDRVTTRSELSDLIAQMVSELSALHTFVIGGDFRKGEDNISPSSLGAAARDEGKGGYRVEHLYRFDPDEPDMAGPLAKIAVDVREGDVIEQVNGRPSLSEPDIGYFLRQQADKQVRLRVKPVSGKPSRDVIVTPLSSDEAADRRYHEWEYTRRMSVEEKGKGQIGYVHLRAMEGRKLHRMGQGIFPGVEPPGPDHRCPP